MPELPEVETIANGLRQGGFGHPSILSRRITGVHLLWERTLALPSPQEFERRSIGQVIHEIGRRGKFLLLHLSQDTLLFHLRMSGDLLVEPLDSDPAPYHRLMLELDEGLRLSFNDTRKFGRAWLVADPVEVLGDLGPEPLDLALSAETFHARCSVRRRQLKPLLLDQTFLAGLGNIYSDEALFLAGLHPQTLAHTLALAQADRLLQSIRTVLQEGIRHHGASIDWVYRGGDFQNYFRVYQRNGQPCRLCGSPIQRILLGQRSTHFCPVCQPPLLNPHHP
jgi:formamidopyrimidine-DNA glycosylase